MLPCHITLDFFNDDLLSLGAAVSLAYGKSAEPQSKVRKSQTQKLIAYFACHSLPIAEIAGTKIVRRADAVQFCENKMSLAPAAA